MDRYGPKIARQFAEDEEMLGSDKINQLQQIHLLNAISELGKPGVMERPAGPSRARSSSPTAPRFQRPRQPRSPDRRGQKSQRFGRCNYCKEEGHWKSECPVLHPRKSKRE